MSRKRFQRNIPMLQALYKTTPKKRKQMIESLSDDTVKVNIAPMGKFIPFLGSLHDIEHGHNLKNQKN